MKKYITILFVAIAVVFSSCKKEFEPGGTEVEKMAGNWWVTSVEMKDGKEVADTKTENFLINTYNTASNSSTEMWVDDATFLKGKVKVGVDYSNRTFSADEFTETAAKDKKVKITEGKVLQGKATTPSGMPADSIVYMMQFENDAKIYKVSGFRRTGFPADDF